MGIRTGIGTYSILNTGDIEVTANSVATGGYRVSPGSLDAGHANSATTLYAEGRAWGIWTGGTVDIINRGDITVTATPVTFMDSGDGDGGPLISQETWGTATGIDTSRASGNQTWSMTAISSCAPAPRTTWSMMATSTT